MNRSRGSAGSDVTLYRCPLGFGGCIAALWASAVPAAAAAAAASAAAAAA